MGKHSAYIKYFICKILKFCILPIIETYIDFRENVPAPIDIKWVAKKNGKVPKHAFVAGMDAEKFVYIIRAAYSSNVYGNGEMIPGKLKQDDKFGYVTYGGRLLAESNYEVGFQSGNTVYLINLFLID